MTQKNPPPLSDVQYEVMTVVWDLAPCSASDVWKVLHKRRGVTRNTVHTLLVRLEDKNWLNRDIVAGHVLFQATLSRQATQQQCVRRLIDTVFDGSAQGLVLTLLNLRTISEEEAVRIGRMIE